MSVHVTANPSAGTARLGHRQATPHLPVILFCTRAARGPAARSGPPTPDDQYLLKSAERREHEATCKGGLIVVGGR